MMWRGDGVETTSAPSSNDARAAIPGYSRSRLLGSHGFARPMKSIKECRFPGCATSTVTT